MHASKQALDLFETLADSFQPSHLVTLARDVETHLEEIRAAAKQNELLPLDLAEELAGKLQKLLADLAELPTDDQRLVIGAARYFISTDDVHPDTETVLGLDDDAFIFNHVVQRIGRSDLLIDL